MVSSTSSTRALSTLTSKRSFTEPSSLAKHRFGECTYASRRDGWERWGFDYRYEVAVCHHTYKAVLVRDERGVKFWVPFKAIHTESEVPGQNEGMLIVKPWFAQLRGWLDRSYWTVFEESEWQQ